MPSPNVLIKLDGTLHQQQPEVLAELNKRVVNGDWAHLGICDYTLSKQFFAKAEFPNLCDPSNGVASDGNIRHGHYLFVVVNGTKRIEFRNGVPYGKLESGGWIRLRTLHFVGQDKAQMPAYWRASLASRSGLARSV